MMAKKSGEQYLIMLHEDEVASIVTDLAKYGMREHYHKASYDFMMAVNRLHWADHGFNISDAVKPYSDLIEWSDPGASEESE